jgi:hypothetical protein
MAIKIFGFVKRWGLVLDPMSYFQFLMNEGAPCSYYGYEISLLMAGKPSFIEH